MKFTLDNKDLTDGFFEDTKLLGIQAPISDYRFCWHVNRELGVDFRANPEIEIQLNKKGRTYFFPIYEYCEPSTCLVHYLYDNQHDGEYLLPEFKHLDYLWLMKDDYVPQESLQKLIQSIKTIDGVQLVVELSPDKIKNKEHLVF